MPHKILVVEDDIAIQGFCQTVLESAGTVTITVNRTGGTQGAAQASYATVPGGTATSGLDYLSASGTLTWPNGDASPKSFSVTILDDNLAETNETVNLVLSNSSGAYLGPPSTAVLTIVEDNYEAWKFAHFGTNANNSAATAFIQRPPQFFSPFMRWMFVNPMKPSAASMRMPTPAPKYPP